MSESELQQIEAALETRTKAHRAFFVPIVRAIEMLGGRARRRDVHQKLREILRDQLNERQLDYLETKGRYGWARNDLRVHGLVAGEYGYWELTELGRAYAARHASDPIRIDLEIPEADAPARSGVVTEPVTVTAFRGYEVPLLAVMADGYTARADILKNLEKAIGDKLLPGDFRVMPGRYPVWEFRASWALSNLGKEGSAENTGTGEWTITSAGRERLEKARPTWDITAYQNSQAMVRVEGTPVAPPRTWDATRWNALRDEIPEDVFDQLHSRLRPDLGPSPEPPIPRNVVLYGPPGTGVVRIAARLPAPARLRCPGPRPNRLRRDGSHGRERCPNAVHRLRPASADAAQLLALGSALGDCERSGASRGGGSRASAARRLARRCSAARRSRPSVRQEVAVSDRASL